MSAINVNLNGANYPVPGDGDPSWGPNTQAVIVALATAFPQLGGSWPLLSELDLGGVAGLKALYLKSRLTNPAAGGILRLNKSDLLSWRNNANTNDVSVGIGVTGSAPADQLIYSFSGGFTLLSGQCYAEANTTAGPSMASGASTVVNYATVVTDTDSAVTPGATWKFTVPASKDGRYLVTATATLVGLTVDTGILAINIQKNGSNVAAGTQTTAKNGTGWGLTASAVVNCVAADQLAVNVFNSNGGARNLSVNAPENRITIQRLV